MPYIKDVETRVNLDLGHKWPATAGELNYLIHTTIDEFFVVQKAEQGKVGYAEFNAVLGVLEAVKLELYRRMIAPYEDEKREANGDVEPYVSGL